MTADIDDPEAPVAQLDRASDFESEGREFESLRARQQLFDFDSESLRDFFELDDRSTRTGGGGLGLAIAAELVRLHGGEISVVDGTIGATFRFTIPDRTVDLDTQRDKRARA